MCGSLSTKARRCTRSFVTRRARAVCCLRPAALSAFGRRVHRESASLGRSSLASGRSRHSPSRSTPRELEILRLVAEGLRNQEIADRLAISLATVKRHIANTYGKLGVAHRTAAVARPTS